ncbi:MAG: SGNH/GDSL hydrolase family protein [Kiritimatiellia bacterium]|jgi:lysophospholipase L1-like esterase
MKKRLSGLVSFAILFCVSAAFADVAVKNGDAIAFLGDSITQQGNNAASGYIHLVIDGLKAAGVEAKPVAAGISGHKSDNMLARVEKDVIEKKPQWMTLSCGVNDVWHGARGVSLEDYKANITALVGKVDAAGIKIMILTATMITEDPNAANNQKLAPYNDFLRQLAKERGYLLADLNADMQKGVKQGIRFTTDGVHMAFAGNKMMASGILRAFGLSEEAVAESNKRWNDRPGTAQIRISVSENQHKALVEAAKQAGKSVEAYVAEKALAD